MVISGCDEMWFLCESRFARTEGSVRIIGPDPAVTD